MLLSDFLDHFLNLLSIFWYVHKRRRSLLSNPSTLTRLLSGLVILMVLRMAALESARVWSVVLREAM